MAAVCAHSVISAAFHRHKHHSSIWLLVQGIQASSDVTFVLFFWSLSAHSASTVDEPPAGHHRTWRYCQQRIVSFSRTIYIFLKEKYYQQYILSLFKVVLMGFEQCYFSSHTCML